MHVKSHRLEDMLTKQKHRVTADSWPHTHSVQLPEPTLRRHSETAVTVKGAVLGVGALPNGKLLG